MSAQGRWPVRDNRNVLTLQHGAVAAPSLIDLEGLTAVSGSGGGYLSNEISCRALRLGRLLGSEVLIGHIHTPRIEGFDADMEMQVGEQLRRRLIAAVEATKVELGLSLSLSFVAWGFGAGTEAEDQREKNERQAQRSFHGTR